MIYTCDFDLDFSVQGHIVSEEESQELWLTFVFKFVLSNGS